VRSIAALFAVLLGHYGYEFAALLSGGDLEKGSSIWFYCFRGIEGVILCYLLLPVFQKHKDWLGSVGVFAVLLGMLEEGQTAVCGAVGAGIRVPFWSTLCLEEFGPLPYLMLTALALTLVVKGIKNR
jgi:uncharacterized membrane protein YuzA (DUF378 family)